MSRPAATKNTLTTKPLHTLSYVCAKTVRFRWLILRFSIIIST